MGERDDLKPYLTMKQHKELSRHSLQTVGEPERLKLTLMHSPQGVFADGADIAMVQVEVWMAMENDAR